MDSNALEILNIYNKYYWEEGIVSKKKINSIFYKVLDPLVKSGGRYGWCSCGAGKFIYKTNLIKNTELYIIGPNKLSNYLIVCNGNDLIDICKIDLPIISTTNNQKRFIRDFIDLICIK